MPKFASLRQVFQGKIAGPAIVATICMVPVLADAMPIVAFGDSLSDTGNVAVLTRGAIPPSSFYFNGRFSDGQIWLDRLGTALGGSVDPVLSGGTNFAFGAARISENPSVPSLRSQANEFIDRTAATGADPGTLYVVAGGGNDIRDALGSSDPIGAVTLAAGQLAGIVDDLAAAGAVDIVIPSLVNVGLTPEARQAGPTVASVAGVLTQIFNQTLAASLANVDAAREINLIRPDFFSLLQSITASPASYGIANATDPCLPGSPFGLPPDITACSDPDRFLFWDVLHPTSTVHALFADAALEAIDAALGPVVAVPEPPPAALIAPMLLAGLLLGVGSSRGGASTLPGRSR